MASCFSLNHSIHDVVRPFGIVSRNYPFENNHFAQLWHGSRSKRNDYAELISTAAIAQPIFAVDKYEAAPDGMAFANNLISSSIVGQLFDAPNVFNVRNIPPSNSTESYDHKENDDYNGPFFPVSPHRFFSGDLHDVLRA